MPPEEAHTPIAITHFGSGTVDEADLSAGPAIEHRARALAVSRDHPLAACGTASAEDLADYETAWVPPGALHDVYDAVIPPRTPSGRPVRRSRAVGGLHETLALVASGQVVHPTVAGLPWHSAATSPSSRSPDCPP